MTNQKIDLGSVDDIIDELKSKYQLGGIDTVSKWVKKTFNPGKGIRVARDVTNLQNVEEKTVYDRAIVELDNRGEETGLYYLAPIYNDAESQDLFLSIRLHFIDEPLELLIFIES